MENETLTFHRGAKGVLGQLDSDERARVEAELATLAAIPPDRWPVVKVKHLTEGQKLLLVPIDDQWRAFVQVEEGTTPIVMDLALQDTLEAFARAAARTEK